METPRAAGLSPTLRQLMIFILAVGTVSAVMVNCFKKGYFGNTPDFLCMNIGTTLAGVAVLWLMLLLFLFDRPGPIRSWYLRLINAGWGLWAGLVFVAVELVSYALSGRTTMLFPWMPIIGVVCLAGSSFSLRSTLAAVCSSCRRKAVIPVSTRFGTNRVRHDTGWCAACGAGYERTGNGPWQLADAPANDDPAREHASAELPQTTRSH